MNEEVYHIDAPIPAAQAWEQMQRALDFCMPVKERRVNRKMQLMLPAFLWCVTFLFFYLYIGNEHVATNLKTSQFSIQASNTITAATSPMMINKLTNSGVSHNIDKIFLANTYVDKRNDYAVVNVLHAGAVIPKASISLVAFLN